MADSIILPGARARLVDQGGLCTGEYYRFFQRLASVQSVTEVTNQVTKIITILEGGGAFLPTSTKILGSPDVLAVGTLASGVVSLSLSDTGVTPGTYGGGIDIPTFTVDEKGRLYFASSQALIAGNGISFDMDPDTGAVTISVNSFVANNRVTEAGDTRVTPSGDIRITR
jgi:hypothetical protein